MEVIKKRVPDNFVVYFRETQSSPIEKIVFQIHPSQDQIQEYFDREFGGVWFWSIHSPWINHS